MSGPDRGSAQPPVLLASNYSPQTARLMRFGAARVDRLKCPAWPEVIERARCVGPVYVHFPLAVGWGLGAAISTETGEPADWDRVRRMLSDTGTRLVNLHLAPHEVLCAPTDSGADVEGTVRVVVQRLIRDVGGVVAELGTDDVVLENDYECDGATINPALLPETLCEVLRATGVGLLLDLSHARLAARRLGADVREYVESLPVHLLREVHVSGVQQLEPLWADLIREGGVDGTEIERFLARSVDGLFDHLPMTHKDWELTAWALERVHSGAWRRPWAVAFEYGGVGPWFAPVTDGPTLARQLPQLQAIVRSSVKSRTTAG